MSKFNKNTNTLKTTNLAGGSAYKITDLKLKLALYVLTSFVNEKKFYMDNTKEIVSTIQKVLDIDPKFVANLAIYARKEMYLRSVSHVLICELAKHPQGKKYVRQTIKEAVLRVDDMTEILALYINKYGKPIPNSLKKGLADAFHKFDEYQLAKYNRDGAVKLKDLVALTNPSPKINGVVSDSRYELIGKVYNDSLQTPETWEVILSANDGRSKKEKWEYLIDSKKLGYMATLRNLRNILEVCDSEHVDKVLNYITNENAIKNSMQLPMRFYVAYREIENSAVGSSKVLNAIETALELSASNIPLLKGKTFLVADVSGSMNHKLSEKSTITYKNIGTLLMAIAHKFCEDAITSVFAQDFKVINVSSRNGAISNMNTFERINVGYSTYLYKALQYLVDNRILVDRIIVFSDMQCYADDYYGIGVQSLLEKYKKEVNPNVFLHSIDLASYDGTTQFHPSRRINLISGWNDKILTYISLVEQGENKLVDDINNYFFK